MHFTAKLQKIHQLHYPLGEQSTRFRRHTFKSTIYLSMKQLKSHRLPLAIAVFILILFTSACGPTRTYWGVESEYHSDDYYAKPYKHKKPKHHKSKKHKKHRHHDDWDWDDLASDWVDGEWDD